MTRKALNVSFGRRSVLFRSSSPDLVAVDPLVLDAMSDELQQIGSAPAGERLRKLAALEGPLKIGLYRIPAFEPGLYEIGLDDLERLQTAGSESGSFEVDTGTIVFLDSAYLAPVAAALTWDRFDRALQSPVGDDTAWLSLGDQVGGQYFGILSADASSSFSGDGVYRLRSGVPRRLGGVGEAG